MFYYYLYACSNICLIIVMILLLRSLFSRLESHENRCLFMAVVGLGIELAAWFGMSHLSVTESGIFGLRISLEGQMLFGIGFLGYLSIMYKPKYMKIVSTIWFISLASCFVHTYGQNRSYSYLEDPHYIDIAHINVFTGSRGLIYISHSVVVLLLGFYATVVILRSLVTRKKTYDKAVWMNDVFYLVAIFVQGIAYILTEIFFGKTPNITPLFRGACTVVYAALSLKYNFLNFDRLARQSLMNDIGAGFIVVSDRLEKLYANELAEDLLRDYGGVTGQTHIIRQAIAQKETQLEKNGMTYRVTSDVIMANGKIDGYTILLVDITDISTLRNRDQYNEESRKNLLTNISHELRTPLNAIIGASEMISSEKQAQEDYKEYAGVIRAAAMNLNDILGDIISASSEYGEESFSADIAPYSLCTLLDNVVELCAGRVAGKDVSFNVSISENIPINVIGDDKHVRQILLSVLNNAIRCTNEGSVSLRISGEYLSEDRFQYIYTVQDTGAPVFKDDVDLGRAISTGNELGVDYTSGYSISLMVAKKIANALGGDLYVVSVTEHNNVYTIRIPSRIVNRSTLRDINIQEELRLVLLGDLGEGTSELKASCDNIGINVAVYENLSHLRRLSRDEKIKVVLFDYGRMGKKVASSGRLASYIKVAVLPAGTVPGELDRDYIYIKAPLSGLTLYRLYNEILLKKHESNSEIRAFVAPKARILVVDDNVMNLQVASHMIESFKAEADVCRSGYECLEKIQQGNHYDMILMDYMMEGMDGIETTSYIRTQGAGMSEVPVLAYTANAVEGTEEKYKAMGMNGCIYKPASIEAIGKALREFLPEELIVYEANTNKRRSQNKSSEYPDIEGVDKETAARYSGDNLDFYLEMLSSFALGVDENESKIMKAQAEGRFKDFTVLVHGIKGLARTIGIEGLAEKMADLEKAGKEENLDYIRKNLPGTLSLYRRYKVLLTPYIRVDENLSGNRIPKDKVEETLIKMHNLLEDFEMDETESLFKEIWPGEYDEERVKLFMGLKESIERVDYYASKDFVDALLKTYK